MSRPAVGPASVFLTHTAALDRLLRETGARLVVIDPILAFLDSNIDANCGQAVRSAGAAEPSGGAPPGTRTDAAAPEQVGPRAGAVPGVRLHRPGRGVPLRLAGRPRPGGAGAARGGRGAQQEVRSQRVHRDRAQRGYWLLRGSTCPAATRSGTRPSRPCANAARPASPSTTRKNSNDKVTEGWVGRVFEAHRPSHWGRGGLRILCGSFPFERE